MPTDAETGKWEWGYTHSQGTNWVGDEMRARHDMRQSMLRDERLQWQARRRQRLVKRWVGNVVEVENPWADFGTTEAASLVEGTTEDADRD